MIPDTQGASRIVRLADAVVAVRSLEGAVTDTDLLPGEHGLVDAAPSEQRAMELRAGRAAARDAFHAAGVTPRPSVLAAPDGRPRLEPPGGWHVSLAHDGGLAAAAVGHAPVGLDLFDLARTEQASRVVARRIESGRARDLVGEHRPFPHAAMLWTAWEALGKRTGAGVFGGMEITLEPRPGDLPAEARTGDVLVRWWQHDGVLVCLAS